MIKLDFGCLYTSTVSNFSFLSIENRFPCEKLKANLVALVEIFRRLCLKKKERKKETDR